MCSARMGMLAGEGTFCGRGLSGVSDWCRMCSASCGGLELGLMKTVELRAASAELAMLAEHDGVREVNAKASTVRNAPSRQGCKGCRWSY